MSNKKYQNKRQGSNSSNTTASLGAKVTALAAAVRDGSGLLNKPELKEELNVDGTFLDDLRSSLPSEQADRFAPWLDQFARFCKELNKKSALLDEGRKTVQETIESAEEEMKKNRQDLEDEIAKERDRLRQEEKNLQEQHDSLLTDREKLNAESEALKPRAEEISRREGELVDRELALEFKELEARNGFASLKNEALDGLKQEIKSLEADRDRLKLEVELQHEVMSGAQREKDAALVQREHELKVSQQRLDTKHRRLRQLQDELDDERKDIQKTLDELMVQERECFELERDRQNQAVNRAYEKVDALSRQLSDVKELQAVLGEREPQVLLDELEELRRTNSALRSSAVGSDLERLEGDNTFLRDHVAQLESQLRDLIPELEESKSELSRRRMGASDLKRLSDEKRTLEVNNQLLGARLNELSSQVNHLTEANQAKSAFPELSGMDSDDTYRIVPVIEDVPESLESFAEELQHRIAQVEEETKLYYPIEDIRALLGGLAMSQLHVFQGISGTGKTSLAKAFAKAMGGFCEDVAVQAGWRDRDDLLGHYNAFEKRFYEKDCLQGLYKAQTDAWKDRCNVILLDEMNLSRPEQYFAEFLSALEKNNPRERLITLSENGMDDAPRLFINKRRILVPRNVWFIGTANHDETTNELADKTYDRAHVMTLPRQEETFEIRAMERVRYSFSSLQKRFEKAINSHRKEVEELLENLKTSRLTTVLGEGFGLGWGNRFERQAKRFVPVMMAAGATKQDALDHLLATRVMRSGKVTGRYDIDLDQLGQVEDAVVELWRDLGGNSSAVKSMLQIEEDRRRKERSV